MTWPVTRKLHLTNCTNLNLGSKTQTVQYLPASSTLILGRFLHSFMFYPTMEFFKSNFYFFFLLQWWKKTFYFYFKLSSCLMSFVSSSYFNFSFTLYQIFSHTNQKNSIKFLVKFAHSFVNWIAYIYKYIWNLKTH